MGSFTHPDITFRVRTMIMPWVHLLVDLCTTCSCARGRKGGRGPLEPPPRESTFWVRAGRTRSRRPRPGRGRRRSSTWPCAGGRDATHVLAAVNLFHPTTWRTRRCEMEVSTGEGADLVRMPPPSTVSCHRPQPPPPCLHHVLECQGRPCCRPPGATRDGTCRKSSSRRMLPT